MIRGVSFEVPQGMGKILYQMLKCINVEEYIWYNISEQEEVHASSPDDRFFEFDEYSGSEFLDLIRQECFIVFLKLQAYFTDGDFTNVHSYEEYQKSDCQLVVLMYDCYYVYIYAKDEGITQALFENALMCGYTKVAYISDDNDERTGMDIR